MKKKLNFQLELGRYYRTYGNWKVLIIWINEYSVWAVHFPPLPSKPSEMEEEWDELGFSMGHEEMVIQHNPYTGKALASFSINEPPTYDSNAPADIASLWKQKPHKIVSRFQMMDHDE